jgi:hypothetical protein
MSFNVLAIRTGSDAGDGALYPVLSDPDEPRLLALDDYDGSDTTTFVATALRVIQVGQPHKTLVRLRDVKIEVLVTDARLALACEKYDKGGGWVGFGVGAFVVAQAANAVSKARAAKRSRGKVLVGHVRYPWVTAVGATVKSGFLTEEAIRLEIREKEGGATVRKLLELTLPRGTSATIVAQDLARRVASYRLTIKSDLAPEHRAAFTALSQGPALLTPEPRKFAYYWMPTFFHVTARTAFPARLGGAGVASAGVASVAGADVAVADVAVSDVGVGETGVAVADVADADVADADVADADAADAGVPDAESAGPPAASAAPGGTDATGPAPLFCTKCGTRNVVGNNFCKSCGAPLKAPVS